MKKNITLLAALSFAGIMASGTAAAGNQTTVNFKGEIVSAACGIATESVDQTIQLGQHPTHMFKAAGDSSRPEPFSIKLIECDSAVSTSAVFTFTGSPNTKNPALFAVDGGARGVGVRLYHGGQPIDNNSEAAKMQLADGTNVITFGAGFEASGDTVVAGAAEGTATLNISYI